MLTKLIAHGKHVKKRFSHETYAFWTVVEGVDTKSKKVEDLLDTSGQWSGQEKCWDGAL